MSNNSRTRELRAVLDSMPDLAARINQEAVLKEYEKGHLFSSGVAIKILSIIGGIMASLTFFGFLFIAGLYDSESTLYFLGFSMITGGVVLNRIANNILFDTFTIALFLIGNFTLGMAWDKSGMEESTMCLLYMGVGALSILVTRSYMLAFLSFLFISISLAFLIFEVKANNFLHAYILGFVTLFFVWDYFEAKILALHSALSSLFNPIRLGLLFTVLTGIFLIKDVDTSKYSIDHPWIISLGILVLMIILLMNISHVIGHMSSQQKIVFYVALCIILAPTFVTPSIVASCFILLLTFYSGHAAGIVLSAISFIYFISRFYYDLNYSLLTKSILMMASGVGFGILFFVLSRNFQKNEQA